MTWAQFLLDFTKWWTISTFLLAFFFIVYYTIKAPWWETPFGRSIVFLDGALGIAVLPGFLFYVFNVNIMNDRATAIILLGALVMVPSILAYRLYALWAYSHRKFWQKFRETFKAQKNNSE